jgi:hypothetical protein
MSDKPPKKLAEHTADVQSLDVELSNKIEQAFRNQAPNFIDVYPLDKNRRDKLERLSTLPIKPNEKVDAVQAVKMANAIVSDCQNDCDAKWGGALRPREQIYQVLIIDEHRGGKANPVATHNLALLPRVSRPAPQKRDGDEEDSPITGTSMIERIFNKSQERESESTETILSAAGDIMLLQKSQNEKLFGVVMEQISENRTTLKEMGALVREQGQRLVELQAVAIESKTADEDIADRRAERNSKHMLTQFAADTLKDARELLGPFVSEVLSDVMGKPQIADGKEKKRLNGKTNGEAKPGEEPPKDAGPSEEREIVTSLLVEVEKLGLDEFLFGHVDEETNVIDKPGVFTKEQADILMSVQKGEAGPSALDVLVPDSGSPLAFTVAQGKTVRDRVPLHLLAKVFKLFNLCKRRGAAPNGEANA